MNAGASPRWRSWLLLIISAMGVLLALAISALLLITGGLALVNETSPASQNLMVLNMGVASAAVALLCVPAIVLSIRELTGKPVPERPLRRLYIPASVALLVWIGLVFLFKPLETSSLAWLLLPPLVIIATIIPLWWYLETGRRGLAIGSPARTWGTVGFSLVVTLPLVLIVELVFLVVILFSVGLYAGFQPQLYSQLQNLSQLFSDLSRNSERIQSLVGQLFNQPGVIAFVLAVTAGFIPLIEELFKPLAVWLLAGDRINPPQGFVVGMWSGACFALYENLTALSASGTGEGTVILLARVGTGLLHIITTGIVGWGLASFWQNRKNLSKLILAYLLAVLLHGIWNASGVIAGIAPFLPLPANTPALFAGLNEYASITLIILVVLNLVLLFFINYRLRKEVVSQNSSPGISIEPADPAPPAHSQPIPPPDGQENP